jgi:spore coat protein CotH
VPDGPTPLDPTEALFHPDRVLQVEIWMDQQDWEELRSQSRHYLDLIGADCLISAPERPYTWFPSDVSIDGVLVTDVGVRKKGFFGSVSEDKPSLKIDFAEYVGGQRLAGLQRMTLNNNLADPSQIKQCLGYSLYAQAGVPAPRCNFATVWVNGDPLATYTHLEPVKRPFLARHFDDDGGNLYEGALADFRPGWVDVLERKTNRDDPDRSDVEALVAALQVEDDVLLQALDPLVDLERFLDLWAMDVLLMHGDGYARNTNNFYIYRDPATQRFTFIPWGIDVILEPDRARSWEEAPPPGVAWAEGALARRLYRHPEAQAAYLSRIQTLLDEVWIEEEILAEIDRMETVWAPHITEYEEFIAESVDDVRDYVITRRADLEAILAEPPATWDRPLRDPWCIGAIGEVSGTFEGSWDTLDELDPPTAGDGAVDVDDESYSGALALTAGPLDDEVGLLQLELQVGGGRSFVVRIPVELSLVAGPGPLDVTIEPGGGTLFEITEPDDGGPPVETARGYLDGGVVRLNVTGTDSGAALVGSVDSALYPVLE